MSWASPQKNRLAGPAHALSQFTAAPAPSTPLSGWDTDRVSHHKGGSSCRGKQEEGLAETEGAPSGVLIFLLSTWMMV